MVRITLRMPSEISSNVAQIARNEQKSQNRVIVEACEKMIELYQKRKGRRDEHGGQS